MTEGGSEDSLECGLYERLLDEELEELLASYPELSPIFEKVETEREVADHSHLIAQILRQVLPSVKDSSRIALTNRIIDLLASQDGLEYTRKRRLLERPKSLLTQILPSDDHPPFLVPETPLSISSLLTGAADDPPLEREIRAEILTADRVDILVSFIKWSGLSLLLSAFEEIEEKGVPVRIITTSYMGASDPPAIEWLSERSNVEMKISYDTERTRLHAKAYHFYRKTGYTTAYIGSANMSRPAMTSGLEWTVKVTAQDMPHMVERFIAEFESYWQHHGFVPYDHASADRFREAIESVRSPKTDQTARFFADITPHPFQERVLESLQASRSTGSYRNLVVAATGTGKTVMAAFDYARFKGANPANSRLLFVVHRKEILEQARDCFRMVLRDFNFGELLVDGHRPGKWEAVFASVQSLATNRPWDRLGKTHFDFIIVDEAHHGVASSYRPLFDSLESQILLGLSATPERMDGSSILPDFDNRFAAEIRLPEALEEKLLCPFHYFGVTDPVSISDERFWRNGRYDVTELESVYTGDDIRALSRLNAIIAALHRYYPEIETAKAVGFCVSVDHAHYMARKFKELGLAAEVITGKTPQETRANLLQEFRSGEFQFLFVVDVLSEGIDIPEINLVMFLRPTESLTVFLQQLGRGLRLAPEKECLTVLDLVGQTHRRYRIDRKFSALLRGKRRRIDREIERDFPNLPPGCSIQLERVAREYVLENVSRSLGDLKNFVPEAIRTFEAETGKVLSFGEFVNEVEISPIDLLKNQTWSEWKDLAYGTQSVTDSDLRDTRGTMRRVALRTDLEMLGKLNQLVKAGSDAADFLSRMTANEIASIHYLLWGKDGKNLGVASYAESISKWAGNLASVSDLLEIIQWKMTRTEPYLTSRLSLPFPCPLRLHAAYGLREISAAFGKANLETSGPTGTGVIHLKEQSAYIHLVTFRKEEKDFSPTTRYKDYPISSRRLHWESQTNTTQSSLTGQNYITFRERGYTVLFFARLDKKIDGETAPFVFLGPANDLISFEGDRPIKMVWELETPMPADLYEEARAA